MTKFRVSLLSLILMQVLFSAYAVLADTGPKPTMEFTFKQDLPEGEKHTIVSGTLYECDQSDCSDAAPLEEVGPQGFYCDAQSCRAIAYGFAPYHRLEIELSDEITRQSNIFETVGFDSRYTVTVQPDNLLVEGQLSLGILPPIAIIALTCICVLAGLGLIVGLIFFIRRRTAQT
jgi:hypothetical protein